MMSKTKKNIHYRFIAGVIIFSALQFINCVKFVNDVFFLVLLNFSSIFYFIIGTFSLGVFFEIILHMDFWQRRVSNFKILLGGVTGFIAFQSIKACWMSISVFYCAACAEAHLSENLLQRFHCTNSWLDLLLPILVMGIPITTYLINSKRAKNADISEKDDIKIQSNRILILALMISFVSAAFVFVLRLIFDIRSIWSYYDWPFDLDDPLYVWFYPLICIISLAKELLIKETTLTLKLNRIHIILVCAFTVIFILLLIFELFVQ